MLPIVVTRVAVARDGHLPREAWLRYRLDLLTRIAALNVLDAGVPWVWLTCTGWQPEVEALAATLDPRPFVVATSGGIVRNDPPPGFTSTLECTWTDDRVYPGESGPFLTWRLDSDDAFFPEVLSTDWPVSPGGLVSLDAGWQLDWRSRQVARRNLPRGPFLAVCHADRTAMLHTGDHHRRVRERRRVHRVTVPMWVQVVHAQNISNRLVGSRSVDGEVVKRAGIVRR